VLPLEGWRSGAGSKSECVVSVVSANERDTRGSFTQFWMIRFPLQEEKDQRATISEQNRLREQGGRQWMPERAM